MTENLRKLLELAPDFDTVVETLLEDPDTVLNPANAIWLHEEFLRVNVIVNSPLFRAMKEEDEV